MFTYAQVEKALASAFEVRTDAMGAFRGRIKHFQRLGLVPSSPGKGKKISYHREDIYKWAIGLEFAEFGLDPTVIKAQLVFAWPKVRRTLFLDPPDADKLFVFYPNIISGFLTDERPPRTGGLVCLVVDDLSQLPKLPESNVTYELLSRRLGMINLGRLRRDVERALSGDV
jgi:hypothetical protein